MNTNQVYKVIKCPLKSVLKNYDIIQPIIETTVNEINEFPILGYQFIRLYLLDKINNNIDLPIINKQFILDVLRVVGSCKTTQGKKTKASNIKNKDGKADLKLFYDNTFSKLTDINIKPSYTNKTYIIKQTAIEMLKCIKTNISTHFIKHLYRYINVLHKEPRKKIIKEEKDPEKRKELYKELNEDIRI
jgi:hypothetical protein